MVRRDRHPCRSNSAAARAQGSWRIGHSAISAGGVLASGRACREKLLRFALRPSFTQRAVPRVLFWRASEQSRDADASGLERSMVPRRMTRAQGMPGAGRNPWPACEQKMQAAGTTGSAGHPAFPARWACRLLRALPGAPGLLATMIRAAHQHRRERDTSVGVSRPRDLTARCDTMQPPPPHLTSRDDREPSLFIEAGWPERWRRFARRCKP